MRDRHQQLLRSKLAQLKAEQFSKTDDSSLPGGSSRSVAEDDQEPQAGPSDTRSQDSGSRSSQEKDDVPENYNEGEDLLEDCIVEYHR